MKTNLMPEFDMVAKFILQASHPEEYVREVPLFAKSIDLVRIDKNMTQITAIEFKTTNWRKAILQVLGSAIVFDYLEICVLKPVTKQCQQLIIKECTCNGIGLYFLDNQTKLISHEVEPVNREGIWEIQRNQIIEYLKEQISNARVL